MKISIRDLHFVYPRGVEALRGISLEIESGERVAIIGQNGSGKTTLAKQLDALLRPTRGEVWIDDWDTRSKTTAQLARRVGFLFQNPDQQIFKSRVADEVAFGPSRMNLDPAEIEARVESALERAGLAALRDVHPYELQPSERRWVALAAVLAMDTSILILDEPTTGQDAYGIARLGTLIESCRCEGKTIIILSHDIDFVAENCDRVIVMGQGRVLLDGEPHHVLAQGERMAETLVEPPQITRLALALGMQETALSIDEFLKIINNPPA
jgi:energy-coupling factor transport system ATP-binding protein